MSLHRQEEDFWIKRSHFCLTRWPSIWTLPLEGVTGHSLVKLWLVVELIWANNERFWLTAAPTIFSVRELSDISGAVSEVSLDVKAGEIVGIYGLVGTAARNSQRLYLESGAAGWETSL